MRPLRLEFTAFGPYPENAVVDFAALAHRGLFVIAGDTGTGKTTIFDAMLYALFGRTRVDAEEVRSHHAAADVRTAVRFDFEADGSRYVVERAPAQARPKTRGTGTTTQAAAASLVRVDADGSTTSLSTRANDVTAACAAIVGLDAGQFQRVVLLPQGEFARFLTAPSGEREGLLTKLFGGTAHEALAVALRQRATAAREAVADVTSRAAELRSVWSDIAVGAATAHGVGLSTDEEASEPDVETLARATDALGTAAAAADTAAIEAERAATAARTRLAEVSEAARRFTAAAEARVELAGLEGRRVAVTAAADAARLAVEAAGVLEAHDAAERHRRKADDLAARRNELVTDVRTRLAAAGAEIDVPPEGLAVVAARRRAVVAEQGRLLAEHRAVLERRGAAASAVEAARTAQASAAARHGALRDERDRLAADLPTLEVLDTLVEQASAAVGAATSAVEVAEKLAGVTAAAVAAHAAEDAARSAYDDALHRFIASQAPALARLLAPGAPCPVCGSVEHPAPATDSAEPLVERTELDDLGRRVDRARAAAQGLALEAATLHARLGADAHVPVDEFRARRNAAEEALATAHTTREAAFARHRQLTDVEAALGTAVADLAAADAAVPTAEALLAEISTTVASTEATAASIDAADLLAQDAALAEAERLVEGLGERITAAGAARSAADAATGQLTDILGRSPFHDVPAASAARLDDHLVRDAFDAERAAGERALGLTAALDELERLGVPDSAPAVDGAEHAATTADHAATAARARAASLQTLHATAARHRDAHDALLRTTADAVATSERTERVAKVFASGGATRLSFRQWVLGAVLDDVLDAAAVHLVRMSSGRYGLRRRAGTLDLEVTDAHTGRPRSVASLSGGEQFQASLALALGLADVIGRGGTASGHRYDALFVDEGFGSLDPHALGQAVEALYDLQAGGRTVAVITHVEAMKQELHVGIDVRRRHDGCGSVLTVHP